MSKLLKFNFVLKDLTDSRERVSFTKLDITT